jgi:hypothetical protein
MRSANEIAEELSRTYRQTAFPAWQASHPSMQPGAAEPFLIILVPKILRLKVFLPSAAQPSHSIALKTNPTPLKQNFKPRNYCGCDLGQQTALSRAGIPSASEMGIIPVLYGWLLRLRRVSHRSGFGRKLDTFSVTIWGLHHST